MKPKEALVKDGFLPAGSENKRGRLSGEAIERCKELVSQGWNIDGYSVVKSNEPEDEKTAPVAKKTAAPDPNRVYDIPDEVRSEDVWQAYTYVGGKRTEVGMRTVCNSCGASLTYCRCRTPMVWIDFDQQSVVNFTTRTTPLRRPY